MRERINNFFSRNRKPQYIILSIVLISIFSLTIVYAALSVTLNIQGNARVTATDWDIYLSNPRVTNGSATTDVPEIKTGSTLEFSTTLNMPGDFYEFTVDVVNGGDIDAMIENVVKNPELTTEQAKYLKYEITYQNGESITTKQVLAKDTTMPIKVRIEYRNDLVASDLPTGQVVLDLSLTLEYIQSDGTGTTVNNNGAEMKLINVVSGDGTKTGDEVCIKDECFYVMYSDDTTVTMLAKYNLYVGGEYRFISFGNSSWTAYGEEATGKQDSTMLGGVSDQNIYKGTTAFSSDTKKGTNYSDYSGSIVEGYVNNYNSYLITQGVTPIKACLITLDELNDLGCYSGKCNYAPSWVYATSYWMGTADGTDYVRNVSSSGHYGLNTYYYDDSYGVRPVIVISKDYF